MKYRNALVILIVGILSSLFFFTINQNAAAATLSSESPDNGSVTRLWLQVNGVIEGTIYASDGMTPLADVGVTIEGIGIGTCTGADGHYVLIVPLNAGYRVRAGGPSACGGALYVPEWWQEAFAIDQATAINLDETRPTANGVDFSLDANQIDGILADMGTVSGTVTDGTDPLEGIAVTYLQDDGYQEFLGCTDEFGVFSGPVPLDVDFTVYAGGHHGSCGNPEIYAFEFWPETPGPDGATRLHLTAAAPTEPDIDFTLETGGTVRGTVLDGADNPLLNMDMGMSFGFTSVGWGIGICGSDTDGSYEFDGVPYDLPFKVSAATGTNCGGPANYIQETYVDSYNWDGGQWLTTNDLTPVLDPIDFHLEQGGTVSGTVIDQNTDQPIENMGVSANFGGWGIGACTDENGEYTISGIPLDSAFRVNAGGNHGCPGVQNYAQEFWEETPNWDDATQLTLTTGTPDIPDIDFTLEVGGTVSGVVYDQETGMPVPHIRVQAWKEAWYQETCADEYGAYTFSNLPLDDPFRVLAGGDDCPGYPTDYAAEFWHETSNYWWAEEITLTAGASDRPDIDFTLEHGGVITGTVTDATTARIHAYRKRLGHEMQPQGLGFADADMQRGVSEFSGGWRIRLNLARALTMDPDFTPAIAARGLVLPL